MIHEQRKETGYTPAESVHLTASQKGEIRKRAGELLNRLAQHYVRATRWYRETGEQNPDPTAGSMMDQAHAMYQAGITLESTADQVETLDQLNALDSCIRRLYVCAAKADAGMNEQARKFGGNWAATPPAELEAHATMLRDIEAAEVLSGRRAGNHLIEAAGTVERAAAHYQASRAMLLYGVQLSTAKKHAAAGTVYQAAQGILAEATKAIGTAQAIEDAALTAISHLIHDAHLQLEAA